MPGGQYTNLQFQSTSLGLADQWSQIKKNYAAANRLLGDIVKVSLSHASQLVSTASDGPVLHQVTPSSKVVGDMAQFMTANNLDEEQVRAQADSLSLPSSVVEYFQGAIGIPHGGFPQPMQKQVRPFDRFAVTRRHPAPPPFSSSLLASDALVIAMLPTGGEGSTCLCRPPWCRITSSRSGRCLFQASDEEVRPSQFQLTARASFVSAAMSNLKSKYGEQATETNLMSWVMYPKVFEQYMEDVEKFGDVSKLPTRAFIEPMELGEDLQASQMRPQLLHSAELVDVWYELSAHSATRDERMDTRHFAGRLSLRRARPLAFHSRPLGCSIQTTVN